MKIVIIGSGPTALGAGYRLNQLRENGTISKDTQVLIIEKESAVGGLARSITDDQGFTWDLGVHVTGASRFAKFTHVMNNAVQAWNNLPRSVKAYMQHVIQSPDVLDNYVPYPVQDSIPYFPNKIRNQCLREMEELQSIEKPRGDNFGEFTENTFGKTLQKEFIRPYNEKVWTVKLEEMNTCWVENRVPSANIEELRRRSLLSREELVEEEEAKRKVGFRYPRDFCGVGEVWRKISRGMPQSWFHLETAVSKIDTEAKILYTANDKQTSYDHIISTIPMVELGRITGVDNTMGLKHSKVVLVGIGIRKPQPEHTSSLSWLYFPQKDIIFYRCTFISNFNDKMTPDSSKYWSVICEIGVKHDAEVDQQECIDKTVKDLKSHGILTEECEVVDEWIHILPYGYPIPSYDRNAVLKENQIKLQKQSIYSRGRFGSWKYEVANSDHSFMMGYEVVDKILFDTDENVFTL